MAALSIDDPHTAAVVACGVELLPGRLWFASLDCHPQSTTNRRYFTVDYDLQYDPFFADFGPLHIGMVIRFCRALRQHHRAAEAAGAEIVFYTSHHPHQRANAACLAACYCVLEAGLAAVDVWALFDGLYPPLLTFRDASYGMATFGLTVLDVMCGLQKAKRLGWVDVDSFDVNEYDHYSAVQNGDFNWIVPGRLMAFSGPVDGVPGRSTEAVVRPFRARKVRLIIRLNERTYDKVAFTSAAMEHAELEYPDGSNPPGHIVRRFFELAEGVPTGEAMAIHCKAGLGRTGTLIGLYVMKHFGFTAREFIGWSRLCRPGSVIGPQQQYLESIESRMAAAGDTLRQTNPRRAAELGLATLPYDSPAAASRAAAIAAEAIVNEPPARSGGASATASGVRAKATLRAAESAAAADFAATNFSFTALSDGKKSQKGNAAGPGDGTSPDPMARLRRAAPAASLRAMPDAAPKTVIVGSLGDRNTLFPELRP